MSNHLTLPPRHGLTPVGHNLIQVLGGSDPALGGSTPTFAWQPYYGIRDRYLPAARRWATQIQVNNPLDDTGTIWINHHLYPAGGSPLTHCEA